MKEQLELKHLAPYLSFGLNVSQPRHGKNESYLLYGLRYSNYAGEWTVFIDDSRHGDYQNVYLKGIKPILRPLSDLTKEIDHNGEKFAPFHKLKAKYGDDLTIDYKYNISFEDGVEGAESYSYYVELSDCYELYQHLFSWHFDVFGLIDKGLAISYEEAGL